MLELSGLWRHYERTDALAGFDLKVADGAIVAVLGPSGCGKSTLLRIIAGLESPDAGVVCWDGDDLAGVPPHRRGFGLMFQEYVLFPHKDVGKNVGFGLRMRGESATKMAERVREVLDLVGLAGWERRAVSSLSGGEQQRVALARAMAPQPRLLMLDEPLGSLDRTLRERLMVELRDLLTRLGATAIYVTHDQDEAFTIADQVVVMRAGRVEQRGDPQVVWQSPASEFVARFLGWANLADADVDGATARTPWGLLPAPSGAQSGRVRVGIRPDGVRLAPDGELGGTVEQVTFRRDHFELRLQTPGGAQLTVLVGDDQPPSIGTAVNVAVDPPAVVSFSS